jgi:putative nucleotidyltransferase with HDIG domain
VVAWWGLLLAVSFLVTEVVGRILRRLVPLTVLLKLTMIFPDRAPSRFAMARRVGSVRNLEERVRNARKHGLDDDPSRAAETILELVAALSAHDRRTRGHSERVRAFADLLADALHLTQDDRDRLRWSALLHDIGKLEVPSRILNKPGKPEPHEWDTLQRHPAEGARLARPLLPWLGEWGMAIEQHHERFDGDGYPGRLSSDQISLGGRILAVADSFETMTAARSYKKPMSVAAARAELARCAGSQFDPVLVRAFLTVALGRLWRTAGPMSWLAQVPLIGAGAQAARTMATAARVAAGVAAVGVTGAFPLVRGHAAERDPTPLVAEPVEEADLPADDAAMGAAESGGGLGGKGTTAGDPRGEGPNGDKAEDGPGGPDGGSGGGSGSDESGSGGGSTGTIDQVGDTVDDVVDGGGDTVDDVVDEAGDTVDDVVDEVGDVVDTVGDVAGGIGNAIP